MRITFKLITLLTAVAMTCSCGNTKKKVAPVASGTDTTEVDWKYGWTVSASPTLDMDALKEHQAQYPERWKATFEYLKGTDLSRLSPGEYEIIGREVYAIVSEYVPKEEAECNFEVHRRYIDLQYLINGEERMGVTTLDKVVPIGEYDEKKDIVFFKPDAPGLYEVATPEVFYIFFPKDAHRPSIKEKDGVSVKKIVIKIKI